MKVKLKALSFIHIGSGEEISPSEYYIADGDFIRLDMDRLFLDPEFEPMMEKFISSAASQRYIGDLLPSDMLDRYPLYRIPIRGDAKSYMKTNRTVVKSFVKSAGRVYIPGSSIKGSLLSAMIWHVLKGDKRIKEKIESWICDRRVYQDLMDYAFRLLAGRDSPFRVGRFLHWLDVSDSNLKSPENCLEISLARVEGAQRGGKIPVLYEMLKPGQDFEFEIKPRETRYGVDEILRISNEFYGKVLERDKSENVPAEPNLIRLGQGSSAFSTSLLILAEELGITRYRVRPPRTRKRINGAFAMGWARIEIA